MMRQANFTVNGAQQLLSIHLTKAQHCVMTKG